MDKFSFDIFKCENLNKLNIVNKIIFEFNQFYSLQKRTKKSAHLRALKHKESLFLNLIQVIKTFFFLINTKIFFINYQ